MILNNSRGIASLVAVALMSLLISILVLAMTGMMTGELRQATDSENSIKAYYAAESGTEEGIALVKSIMKTSGAAVPANIDDCPSARPSIACMIIAFKGNPTGEIDRDQSRQFDLSNWGSVDHLGLDWDSADASEHDDPLSLIPFSGIGMDIGSNPPPMEVTVSNYPGGGAQGAASVHSILLMPCPTGATNGTLNCNTTSADMLNSGPNQIYYVPCSSTVSGYRCSATLTDLAVPGNLTVLRLQPLIKDSIYQLRIYQTPASTTPLQVALQSAQIDVTSKTGDSYRRILATVPVLSNPYDTYAINGHNAICKDFTVFTAPNYIRDKQHTCPIEDYSFY